MKREDVIGYLESFGFVFVNEDGDGKFSKLRFVINGLENSMMLVINVNKIIGGNNIMSVKLDRKFISRNRSICKLEDIKNVVVNSLNKLKDSSREEYVLISDKVLIEC